MGTAVGCDGALTAMATGACSTRVNLAGALALMCVTALTSMALSSTSLFSKWRQPQTQTGEQEPPQLRFNRSLSAQSTDGRVPVVTDLNVAPAPQDFNRTYTAAIIGTWYGGRHPYTHDRAVHTCPNTGCKIRFTMGDRGGEVDLLLHHMYQQDVMAAQRHMRQRRRLPPSPTNRYLRAVMANDVFSSMFNRKLLVDYNAEVTYRGQSVARDIDGPIQAVALLDDRLLAALPPLASDADVDQLTWSMIAPPMVPLAQRAPVANGSVVWADAHCNSRSGREEFIEQLMRFIPVNAYPRCLRTVDEASLSTSPREQEQRWRRQKFWLAFEDVITADDGHPGDGGSYVTAEAFYLALVRGLVPVVLGSRHVADHAPPGSYINALAFESPRALAAHLLQLDADDNQLARYFEWRDQPIGTYGLFFRSALQVALPVAQAHGTRSKAAMFACNLCLGMAAWHARGRPIDGHVPPFHVEPAVEVHEEPLMPHERPPWLDARDSDVGDTVLEVVTSGSDGSEEEIFLP